MGLSSSKQKTTGSTTATSTSTPTIPGWAQQPFQNYANSVNNFTNSGVEAPSFGPSSLQNAAFGAANGIAGGNWGIQSAIDKTGGLTGFQPSQVSAGQLRDTDLNPYMNPFTSGVIDASLADLERGRAGAIAQGQGAATQAGAYGGSRHGVADSLTNREFADSAGLLSANLRSANFGQAQDAARFDIGNRLGADTFNSQQGLAGANFRLGAANQLGNLGVAQGADQRADIGLLGDLGEQQRGLDMQNSPYMRQLMMLAAQQGLLSGIPLDAVSGRTNTGSGTSTQTTKTGTSGLDWLNAIGQFWGGNAAAAGG